MLTQFEIAAKAVADPSRVRILKLLEHGELCVCQITAALDLATATISKHLSLLRTVGLTQQRRDGKWVYYRLADSDTNPYARRLLAVVADIPATDPILGSDGAQLAKVMDIPLDVLCCTARKA